MACGFSLVERLRLATVTGRHGEPIKVWDKPGSIEFSAPELEQCVDPLNDMALYVEVVKAMSFRRAAEATGIPNSTLSRRISALEKAIGLRLLHRTTRKIEVTEAGLL